MPECPISVYLSDTPVNREKLLQSFQGMQITYMEAVIFHEGLSRYEQEEVFRCMRERLCRTEKQG